MYKFIKPKTLLCELNMYANPLAVYAKHKTQAHHYHIPLFMNSKLTLLCDALPNVERMPQANQMTRLMPTLCVCRRTPTGDTNIPDPIMVPTIRAIPLKRPTCLLRLTFPSLSFLLFVPSGYDPAIPLALSLSLSALERAVVDIADYFWQSVR